MIMMLVTQIYGFIVLSKDKRPVERGKKLFTYKYIITKESPKEAYGKTNPNCKITYWVQMIKDVFLCFSKLFSQMMIKWHIKKNSSPAGVAQWC